MVNDRRTRITGGLAALLLSAAAAGGPDWEEGAFGSGDAKSLPNDAQVPKGQPPLSDLDTISGDLGGLLLAGPGDVQDMYAIYVDEPAIFSAVANPPVAKSSIVLDTQLWLFDELGLGLLGNDGSSGSSGFGNSADDGSGASVASPGLYYLAISVVDSDPVSGGSLPIFDQAVTGEVSGPDGAGGSSPITGWTGGSDAGSYTIFLAGAAFVPCRGDANADGLVDIDDIVAIVLAFGPCPAPPLPCPADVDENGMVDIDDIVEVVLNFDECTPDPP